MMTTTTLT